MNGLVFNFGAMTQCNKGRLNSRMDPKLAEYANRMGMNRGS